MRSRTELRLREQVAGPIIRHGAPLMLLAAYVWRRMLFRTTFIGVTGSLGKTTTKEMLANILAKRARTFRSYRNQNNTIAVALNILRVRPWHRYAVIEAAGAAPGMMRRSARILAPDVAIILNVHRTHTKEFPKLEDHAAEKELLLRSIRRKGIAILNADDPLVMQMKNPGSVTIKWFGQNDKADYRAADAASRWPGRLEFSLHHAGREQRIRTQLVGTQWTGSATAAVAAAMSLDLTPATIADGVAASEPFTARLQPVFLPSGAILIRDDYNSSVDSVDASLQILADAEAQRRILVMTDASDMAVNRRHRLRYLGAKAAEVADAVVFIGSEANYGARRAAAAGMNPSNAHGFKMLRDAAEFLRGELREGDLVLLKGRTTDHAARIFIAQLGDVSCWVEHCPKRMLCDLCWELGASPATLSRAAPVPYPTKSVPLPVAPLAIAAE